MESKNTAQVWLPILGSQIIWVMEAEMEWKFKMRIQAPNMNHPQTTSLRKTWSISSLLIQMMSGSNEISLTNPRPWKPCICLLVFLSRIYIPANQRLLTCNSIKARCPDRNITNWWVLRFRVLRYQRKVLLKLPKKGWGNWTKLMKSEANFRIFPCFIHRWDCQWHPEADLNQRQLCGLVLAYLIARMVFENSDDSPVFLVKNSEEMRRDMKGSKGTDCFGEGRKTLIHLQWWLFLFALKDRVMGGTIVANKELLQRYFGTGD